MTVLYRMISSLMGGLFGTLIVLCIYAISVYLLGNTESPITNFILIFIIFLGSLVSNLICGVFFSLSNSEKYTQTSTMLWQAFILNMFLFLVAFPFYILLENIQNIAFIHLLLSAVASNIIYEFFTKSGVYALSGLYGSFFGTFIIFVSISLVEIGDTFSSFLLFIIFPFIWFLLTLSTLFTEWLYALFYRAFGIAILDPKTKL